MPRHRATPALLLPLCGLLWTGCAPAPPPVVVPASLLSCAPEPAVPQSPDDTALARLIVDLAEAGADCRARLAAVRMVMP